MKPAPLRPRVRFPWRWLVDSPLILSTWCAVMLGARAAHDVDEALGVAQEVRTRASFVMAQVAAEAAAMAVSPDDRDGTERRVEIGDVVVTVKTVGTGLH